MLGIRQKLFLVFGSILLITTIIVIHSIQQFSDLGQAIEVILSENFKSVIAAQKMKESLERMESGALFTLLAYEKEGKELIDKNDKNFIEMLEIELRNLTLPGEPEKAYKIKDLYSEYQKIMQNVSDEQKSLKFRHNEYFTSLLPLSLEIDNVAEDIMQMNQKNMGEASVLAQQKASLARMNMIVYLFICIIIGLFFLLLIKIWILRPLNRLIDSANQIKQGNLDLVIRVNSRDEIGQLSENFNAMTASLREFYRSNRAQLIRIQRATQQTFNSLPDPIALVDLKGLVEVSTEKASVIFGLKPNTLIKDLPYPWLIKMHSEALMTNSPVELEGKDAFIQQFVNGEEHYFQPKAVPILDHDRKTLGVALILKEVTELIQQKEMKKGVIAIVSHQLNTPLTSIRMAIHLLLEEKVGTLLPKQIELLIAARDDSDRLHAIISNLLDISRIESGKVMLDFNLVSPNLLIQEAVNLFMVAAQDQGIALSIEVADDLPEVLADTTRIYHVFTNLISNALKYTPAGGKIILKAEVGDDVIKFSVSDTGKGVPNEYLHKIFEQFFRVPGQSVGTGAGLGLAIAKDIVGAHGGEITVESKEGEGSRFCFTLKRADRVSRNDKT